MLNSTHIASSCGVVAIGRNEGTRLLQCLQSIVGKVAGAVYVDSGSTDGSVTLARSMGVLVVELDMSVSFTAARARNAGFKYLVDSIPDLDYVQFVDGDCEVVDGWLGKAMAYLADHADVVVVCGRLRERYPDKSIYNTLCDIEWNAPLGEVGSCGGNAMIKVASFKAVGGFRPDLIAGEEPELCVRLRAKGGRICRLGEEMALHDADMTRFSQWWQRSRRAGYAYALGAYLHGSPPERHYVLQARRALFWGLLVPVLILIMSIYDLRFLSIFFLYPIKVFRIKMASENIPAPWARAFYLVLGHFPEGLGLLKFYVDKVLRRKTLLIEYK